VSAKVRVEVERDGACSQHGRQTAFGELVLDEDPTKPLIDLARQQRELNPGTVFGDAFVTSQTARTRPEARSPWRRRLPRATRPSPPRARRPPDMLEHRSSRRREIRHPAGGAESRLIVVTQIVYALVGPGSRSFGPDGNAGRPKASRRAQPCSIVSGVRASAVPQTISPSAVTWWDEPTCVRSRRD
jgi:hypothetical protein